MPKYVIFVTNDNNMRYIARAFKYFIQVSVTLAAILAVLMLLGLVSKDINVLFRNGWTSVAWIAAMFAGVSAIYPLFGYARRTIDLDEIPEDARDTVDTYMRSRGYEMSQKNSPHGTVYRDRSLGRRIIRLGEDRVSIDFTPDGITVEGLNRDIVRIVTGLRTILKNNK